MHPSVHNSTVYNSQDMETTGCPLTEEWVEKLWSRYAMEYYSATKRIKTVPSAETWTDLETVTQSEVNWKEKSRYHLLIHICRI